MKLPNHLSSFFSYFLVFALFSAYFYLKELFSNASELIITPESVKQHKDIVEEYYEARKKWETSNLGRHLFKYSITQPYPVQVINVPNRGYFNVLIWQHWEWIKHRHLFGYGYNRNSEELLHDCSVTNCRFWGNETMYSTIDAVVVHLHKGILPNFTVRKPDQRWIFWSDESPQNTFSLSFTLGARQPRLDHLANIFNWSMTYRSDSDIPVPYGRTIPLQYPKLNKITEKGIKKLVPYLDRKQEEVLIAITMSNCIPFRMHFINQLRRYISVDLFGRCSTVEDQKKRCPGHYREDCPIISKYLFYLVIENSQCRQYLTEKIFHNAYSKGAIPIIMGTPLVDCIRLLPPNSFIHIDDYGSVKKLARYIYSVSYNITKLMLYHTWRNNFKVVEEHGFLGVKSLSLCRLCEALNYNSKQTKVYSLHDIRMYLDIDVCCFKERY